MIDQKIHFTLPQRTTRRQEKNIQKARELHPTWEVLVWRDPLPETDFMLGRYFSKCNSGAQLADLIRLEVVNRHGGVYLDSDVILTRPLDQLIENYDFFVSTEDGVRITNAVFGAKASHHVVQDLIGSILNHEPDWSRPPNETTGPEFWSRLLRWRSEITVLPRESFYSFNWNEKYRAPHPLAFGEHLWDNSWKHERISPIRRQSLQAKVTGRFKHILRCVLQVSFRLWSRVKQASRPKEEELPTVPVKVFSCSDELVVRTIHGQKLVVYGRDVSVTPELATSGTYEPREELFVRKTLAGGDWFVDVGANVGVFTVLAAAAVGPFGRVFAIEPNEHVLRLLSKSLVMNWCHDRVSIVNAAAGEQEGECQLKFSSENLGGGLIYTQQSEAVLRTAKILGHENNNMVSMITLDTLIPVNLPVKILKIDVEGNEGHVLRGASRLCKAKCFDYILAEFEPQIAGSNTETIRQEFSVLEQIGYQPCTITSEGDLIPFADLKTAFAHNATRSIVFRAQRDR